MRHPFLAIALSVFLALAAWNGLAAQDPVPVDPVERMENINEQLQARAAEEAASGSAAQDYRIGAEDLLEVSVFEVPELSRTVRVSASGEISLPLLGAVRVGGLSTRETEDLLGKKYVKDPQVTVFLKEFRADPVSVMGAVKMPGNYHIQTRKRLVEVLAMAQGFSEGVGRQPGRYIIVTRKDAGARLSQMAGGDADTIAVLALGLVFSEGCGGVVTGVAGMV
jgi:polysaccharide biosynthesis/export protein